MKLYYRRRFHYGNGDRNLLRGTWAERSMWDRRDMSAILHISMHDAMYVGYDMVTRAGVTVAFVRKGDSPFKPSPCAIVAQGLKT